MLYLFLAIDELRFQVGVPVKGNTFKRSNELIHQPVPFSSSITVHFNEMCNVLFGVVLSIELIEFLR